MKKKNKQLEKWVGNLPQYSPPDELWNNIDSQLNSNAHSKKFPIHIPNNEIWNEIEIKLPKRTIRYQILVRYGIAASVLIAGLFIFFHINTSQTKPILLVEKVVVEVKPELVFNNKSIYEKLAVLCERELNKCDTETFKIKEKSLQEIQVAILEIEEMLSKFPNDNQLVAQNNYFRKQEADALRELILLTTQNI